MNKELGVCISGALSFTKVHLPISRGMAGDQGSGFLQCCCFPQILLSITNHDYNEQHRSVLGST